MFNFHCTNKLLDRIKPELGAPQPSTTRLGNWHATALFWKPQMALAVNERTLLPVLLPLAPAATLADRFPIALRDVLQALHTPAEFIESEISGMSEVVYAKTANRSVLGVMNEFVFLAEGYRDQDGSIDPVALSLKLAGTPCGPLYKGAVFPDKALRELVHGGAIH
jgi:hypothetical protein